uniref:Envelope glycoprotein n=1 Tax=Podarcis muralis TaxID=64176 RepID=A0A670J7W6_PODMU
MTTTISTLLILSIASALSQHTITTHGSCPGLQMEYKYLDFGIVDMVKRGTPDCLGDFDFCLPETRVLLRHSILQTLATHQTWELFIRSPTYTPLGKLILTRDGPWNRAHCLNGSYVLFSDGIPEQTLNWTLLDNGGGDSVYTDRNHPTNHLIHGFYCQRVDSTPRQTILQGVCLRRYCCVWDIGLASGWDGKAYLEGWHYSVTPPAEWDTTGPQRCGGLTTNLTYLLRQDPLHPPGTAPRQRGELSISENPQNNDFLSTWHSNTYVKLISQIAKQTTTKECWICVNAPSHLHSGIPFLGVPLTLQQHLSADVQSWNLTAVNMTHQYIYLTGPTTGDLCRKFSGNDKVIGESTCKYTIDIALNGRITLWHQGNPSIQPSLVSAWKRVMSLPDSWSPSPVSQCFFRTFLTRRIDSCLQGLFWVCVHRGYVWASPHSRGTCYLSLILPGVRVTQDLPSGRRRNKRAKDLSQLSDVAANSETYGRALFPAYGAGSNHVDILKLTDILLNFMEESNAATQAILTELMEVRQTSIQNRLALDYVLASTGGVCALVGAECCTHVSDETLNITGHLNNIHKLADGLKDIQHEGLSDTQLWSWLPGSGWIKQLLGNGLLILITVTICIAVFCCAIHCFPMCCQTCDSCLPTPRPRSTIAHRPPAPGTQPNPIELGPLKDFQNLDSRYDMSDFY